MLQAIFNIKYIFKHFRSEYIVLIYHGLSYWPEHLHGHHHHYLTRNFRHRHRQRHRRRQRYNCYPHRGTLIEILNKGFVAELASDVI